MRSSTLPIRESQPRRRNRTRQREQLLALLRASDAHPTAAELYASARGEFPALSLATVYRNLEVLVTEGLIEQVPSERGAMRYDGNPKPHHHFICEVCGAIRDLELELPEQLAARLRRKYRLRAHKTRIHFFGLCQPCSGRQQPPTE